MSLRDEGLALRLSDYSETSQILTLFTRDHGLVRLIAKGIRRGTKLRHAVGVDLLERGEVQFTAAGAEAGLGKLLDWKQLDAHLGLRRDAARLAAAFYAAEIVPAVTAEYDPHPAVYAALLKLLEDLSARVEVAAAVAAFQAALLRGVGLAPNLRNCVNCGAARSGARGYSFSSQAGGLLCRRCAPEAREKIRLPGTLFGPAPAPGHWISLMNYHLSQIAGRPFSTFRALHAALESRNFSAAPDPRGLESDDAR